MSTSTLHDLAQRYPQLYLAPRQGLSQDPRYQDIVRRGAPADGSPLGSHFIGSQGDRIFRQQTPAGTVEIVFLQNRQDFEQFFRIIAGRGEPLSIPATMGAATISGIINWRRIDAYREAWEAGGGTGWENAFRQFTSDPARYKDTLILVSEGPYSGVPAEAADMPGPEWLAKSLTIRTWHEITHFVCQRQYPELKHALWDEVAADAIGLLAAMGRYDTGLARRFLGLSPNGYAGGRLENYTERRGAALDTLARSIGLLLDEVAACIKAHSGSELYSMLDALEKRAPQWIACYIDHMEE